MASASGSPSAPLGGVACNRVNGVKRCHQPTCDVPVRRSRAATLPDGLMLQQYAMLRLPWCDGFAWHRFGGKMLLGRVRGGGRTARKTGWAM